MSEQDFYSAQGNKFRGSRYANFSGGGIDQYGNVQGVSNVANPSDNTYVSPKSSTESLTSQQSVEIPSVGESLKNAAIGSALPYAGSTIGSAAGAAMAGGATFGEGISQGLTSLGSKVGGFLSGGVGEAAGSVSGNAAGSTAAGAAASTGGAAASDAGGTFSSRLTSGSTLGGAAGVGLGTAAATLLTGGDVETAAKSGAGSAAGYAVGTALSGGNPIGGMIGGALGGVVGGGSVICTELHRQGLISTEQLVVDTNFARQNLSMTIIRGYWLWAKPYVRLMRRDCMTGRVSTRIALAVFSRRYDSILFDIGAETKFSMSGHLIRHIGEAMCYAIGCFLVDTPESRIQGKAI